MLARRHCQALDCGLRDLSHHTPGVSNGAELNNFMPEHVSPYQMELRSSGLSVLEWSEGWCDDNVY